MAILHFHRSYRVLAILIPLFFSTLFALGQKGEGLDSADLKSRSDSIWQLLRKDPRQALELADTNLAIAKADGDKRFIAWALRDMGTIQHALGRPGRSLEFMGKALRLDRELGDSSAVANVLTNMGIAHKDKGDLDSALMRYQEALRYQRGMGEVEDLPSLFNNMGNAHRLLGRYPKALKLYHKGLRVIDSLDEKDEADASMIQGNIGHVHKERGEYEKALEHYRKALSYFEKAEDPSGIASSYLNMGEIFEELGDSSKALEHYREADSLFLKLGDVRKRAIAKYKIADRLKASGELEKAMKLYREVLDSAESIGDQRTIAIARSRIGKVHLERNDYQKALQQGKKGFEAAKGMGSLKWQKSLSGLLYQIHKERGDLAQALAFHEEFFELKDSLMSEERAKKLTRMEMRYKFEKERVQDSLQHAKEQRLKEARIEKQEGIIWAVSGGLALVLILLFLLIDRFRVIRKQKELIRSQKEEVDRAYDELREKNGELEDSIQYASRIQGAILTGDQYLQEVLGEHFVMFRPKEVVSGDFYWAFEDGEHSIWIAADCTGHGVPGAFMSIMGNRSFNEVIVEQGERDPATILEKVREDIIEALEQSDEKGTMDGMDAALCVLEKKKQRLHFAGAHNSLYLVQKVDKGVPYNGPGMEEGGYRLIEVKGDRTPIGRGSGPGSSFNTVTLELEGGESLYTFSDGFPDQFGGAKGKKYRHKPFKRLLLSIQDKGMKEQKEALEREFERWKGDREQVDDVLVIGVRASYG